MILITTLDKLLVRKRKVVYIIILKNETLYTLAYKLPSYGLALSSPTILISAMVYCDFSRASSSWSSRLEFRHQTCNVRNASNSSPANYQWLHIWVLFLLTSFFFPLNYRFEASLLSLIVILYPRGLENQHITCKLHLRLLF